MKSKVKKRCKQVLTGLLALSMLCGILPQNAVSVSAATTAKTKVSSYGRLGNVDVGSKTKTGTWWKINVGSKTAFCLSLGKTCHNGNTYLVTDTHTWNQNTGGEKHGYYAKIIRFYVNDCNRAKKAFVLGQALIWAVSEGNTSEANLKNVIKQVKANTGYFPNKTVADLYKQIFQPKVTGDSHSMGSIMITNYLMEKYGVTPEELHVLAMENMERLSPSVCEPLENVMVEVSASQLSEQEGISFEEAKEHVREMLPPGGTEIYCLSNESKLNGAVSIISENVQKMVAEQVGGDYYVLPSSVHELMIVPKSLGMNLGELEEMVSSVNAACVRDDEVLSNHVYQYDAKEHKFSRCVPERNLKKNLELDLEPAVDVQEEKNTLQSELPEQSHEPMKHSGRIH